MSQLRWECCPGLSRCWQQNCTTQSVTGEELRGISGNSDSNVIAVGKKGEIWQYDGSSWNAMSSPTGKDLNSITVLSGGSAYAVGQKADNSIGGGAKEGNVLKFSGSTWTTIPIADLNQDLQGVWADSGS